MKNKLLLIDGSGLLVANYYGTIPKEVMMAKSDEEKEKAYKLIAQRNGLYINAIYPTIKQIYEMIIKSGATHIAVSFDKSRKTTFRRKMYAEYKGTRKPSPEPLNEQFILCEMILDLLKIPAFYSDEYEADDFVGSIAKQLTNETTETVIYTRDKDYLQLVDKNITVWMGLHNQDAANKILEKYCMTKELGYTEYLPDKVVPYDLNIVKDEKGVLAENFYHVLGLMGDTADNIPGVKGISEVIAEKLIGEYETIDNLYKKIEECNNVNDENKLKQYWKEHLDIKRSPLKALKEQKEMAFLSRDLAKIKIDIDLNIFCNDFSLDKLICPENVIIFKNAYDTSEILFKHEIHNKVFEIIDQIS